MAVAEMYEIEHKCGHTETKDLSAMPAGERAGRVAWLTMKPCFECFKKTSKRKISKEVQAERVELHQAALDDQERAGLPILQGSSRQVDWAVDVRFTLLRAAYEDMVQGGSATEEHFEADVLTLARRIDQAKWWIDNREATVEAFVELLADPGTEFMGNENPY